MKPAATALVFAGAAGTALAVSWRTEVGPIVVSLSATHGVHVGDLAAFTVCGTWALFVAVVAGR